MALRMPPPTVAKDAGATVLTLPFNLGVGGAMRAGFKYAQRLGYQRVIQVDADGQHDPRNIHEVLAGLEHADISIGARFADRGDYSVSGPAQVGHAAPRQGHLRHWPRPGSRT